MSYNIKSVSPQSEMYEYETLVELIQNIEQGIIGVHSIPDFIFLDINLPEIDAWVFLDKIATNSLPLAMKSSKIVVVSSSIDPADRLRALNCEQVVAFLSKPLTKYQIAELFRSN